MKIHENPFKSRHLKDPNRLHSRYLRLAEARKEPVTTRLGGVGSTDLSLWQHGSIS